LFHHEGILVFTLCVLGGCSSRFGIYYTPRASSAVNTFVRASGLAPQPARRRGKDKLINVGDQLRRYEKIDVALHLVCNVTPGATKLYMK